MKYIVVLLVLVGAYQYVNSVGFFGGSDKVAALHAEPYIAVFGRNSCSITQQTLAYMRENHIRYEYLSIDDKAVESTLHQRMEKQGISTRQYNLPVVDFSGELVVRPGKPTILEKSRS